MQKLFSKFSWPILAIGLSTVWWIYLLFTANMLISADAISYESLGRIIIKDGWEKYIAMGPNREPFYPWLISLSMTLANFWHISYIPVQKVVQVGIFFFSQLLLYRLLLRLDIRPIITACVLLYFGFSPALVNSVFSLYSEIATYPFILGIVLISLTLLDELRKSSAARMAMLSVGLFLMLIGITSIKAVFEVVTPIFLVSLFILAANIVRSDKARLKILIVCCMGIFLAFEGCVISYKFINHKLNGHFALTDRGSWALYGNTVRRMQPLTWRSFGAALATAPGDGICKKFFTVKECHYWSADKSDSFGIGALFILDEGAGLSQREIDPMLLELAIQEMDTRPWQFVLLAAVESVKIFFWESTQISFVEYPAWLTRVYDCVLFKNILRLVVALVTILCVIAAVIFLARHRALIFKESAQTKPARWIALFLMLIVPYIGIYSFFFILTRLAFPIAPLYLATIAVMLNQFYGQSQAK